MTDTAVKNDYTQLCVWRSCRLGDETPESFEKFIFNNFNGARIKFCEEVTTLPDVEDGMVVRGTGGRPDLFFYVHSQDIAMFSIPRLKAGISWWEDVLANGGGPLYGKEILEKYPLTW